MRKRQVKQWQVAGRPDDGNERIWTEVQFDVTELAELLGLAPGTGLISMTINREHTTMTWTFEEPREATCASTDDPQAHQEAGLLPVSQDDLPGGAGVHGPVWTW